MSPTCFKAYDIRGRVDGELNEATAHRIGRAVAAVLAPQQAVVGRDARPSSPALCAALSEGLRTSGVDVLDIGLCATEEIYFATAHLGAASGIMVTASHNPPDDNGMKLVGPESRPLSAEEFAALRDAAGHCAKGPGGHGLYRTLDTRPAYAVHVANLVAPAALEPLRTLADAGNGTAGLALDAISDELSRRGARLDLVRRHHAPDPAFPQGIPNPLLPERRREASWAVAREGVDLGVAWDGDGDRCFLFDAAGEFVPGEYVVALLAEAVLTTEPGATIVHDPRAVWAIEETVRRAGGRAVPARPGHAFMKARMRETGAAYGGELSAHHYFRDFFYCDSGMLPWLRIVELLSRTGRSLAEFVAERRARFPSSGEINFELADPLATIERVVDRLGPDARTVNRLDGAGLTFADWRMNLRASNTEPFLRLNLETRGNRELLAEKLDEVRRLIAALG